MGLCNSPDVLQEKMNEFFNDLDYIRTFIDDLLLMNNESLKDHI